MATLQPLRADVKRASKFWTWQPRNDDTGGLQILDMPRLSFVDVCHPNRDHSGFPTPWCVFKFDGYQFLLLVPALFNTSRAGGWNAKANRYFGSGFQQGSRLWEVVWGGDSLKHAKGLRCCKSIQVVQWFHHSLKPKKSRNWVEMTAAAWKSWDSGLGSRSLQQGLQPGSTAEEGSQNSQQQAQWSHVSHVIVSESRNTRFVMICLDFWSVPIFGTWASDILILGPKAGAKGWNCASTIANNFIWFTVWSFVHVCSMFSPSWGDDIDNNDLWPWSAKKAQRAPNR